MSDFYQVCIAAMFYDFANAFMPVICTVLKSGCITFYMGMQANFLKQCLENRGEKGAIKSTHIMHDNT
jgi:hypothetical protein